MCCIGSAGFLGGTIYWAHRMTLNESGLKASALSMPTVIGHIVLLTVESVEVYLIVVAWSTYKYTLSQTRKI
jgi:hypothetical protein